jgi:hypothetical protein
MRHFPILALAAIFLPLIPPAHAREQEDFRERLKNAVERTDKDFGSIVQREKLDQDQRTRFDAAEKDLGDLREAVANWKWEGDRDKLEHAIDNLDFVSKHAPISDSDRQTLGIDLYTLKVIRDSWKPPSEK